MISTDKKIIHIIPDGKFASSFYQLSEGNSPNTSFYIILNKSKPVQFEYEGKNIVILQRTKEVIVDVSTKIKSSSTLVFHSFHKDLLPLLDLDVINKVWMIWGMELFMTKPLSSYVSYLSDFNRFDKSLSLVRLRWLKTRLFNSFNRREQLLYKNIIKKFDYASTWLSTDFVLAQNINSRIKHIPFCYYTETTHRISVKSSNNIKINSVLLGNSADPSNNHFEALKFLDKHKYTGEIICPLSYGGTAVYKKNLLQYGRRIFKNKFIPLTKFLSINEYTKMTSHCDLVWMNHIRQQAAGNIFIAIANNLPVVLNDMSPMRKPLEEVGVTIFGKDIFINSKVGCQKLSSNKSNLIFINPDYNKTYFNFLNNL